MSVTVEGVQAAIGEAVALYRPGGDLIAEVVAIDDDGLVCMPLGELSGIRSGASAEVAPGRLRSPSARPSGAGFSTPWAGPSTAAPASGACRGLHSGGTPPHPLRRDMVDRQLALGVRAIDTLMPCGRGQRMGIFAGSGVGKSSLLSMVARGTEAGHLGAGPGGRARP